MTLSYTPDDALAHRLDPRPKLLVQVGFAAAAYAYTTPRGLVVLTVLALTCLWAAGGGVRTLWPYRFALPFLLTAPVVAGATLGAPWFRVGDAVDTLLASYRVLLILVVAAAYVRSTPVRESRAALQRTVPGKPGQFLGVGVALVFRFLPVLLRDLQSARAAMQARLGDQRPVRERMRIVATAGLSRTLGRADRLGVALQARCFAWNPTLPRLRLTWLDAPALLFGLALLVVAPLGALGVDPAAVLIDAAVPLVEAAVPLVEAAVPLVDAAGRFAETIVAVALL